MLIAKNDEAKRSRIWNRGMIISSVIIVVVAVYLLIKVMNENPVAGEWMDDDGNYAAETKKRINPEKSRRVEIRVITDDYKVLKEIIER